MPEHGSALRAEYCSFWLDFIPKLTIATCKLSIRHVQSVALVFAL
jgi:hypothetical protein